MESRRVLNPSSLGRVSTPFSEGNDFPCRSRKSVEILVIDPREKQFIDGEKELEIYCDPS